MIDEPIMIVVMPDPHGDVETSSITAALPAAHATSSVVIIDNLAPLEQENFERTIRIFSPEIYLPTLRQSPYKGAESWQRNGKRPGRCAK